MNIVTLNIEIEGLAISRSVLIGLVKVVQESIDGFVDYVLRVAVVGEYLLESF